MFALFSWFGCYLVMHECDYCFLTRIQLLYCRLFLGLRNKREKQLLIRNSKYTVSSRKKGNVCTSETAQGEKTDITQSSKLCQHKLK